MTSDLRLQASDRRGTLLAAFCAASALLASVGHSQNDVFVTHDWTLSDPTHEILYNEAWADVKMPGGFPNTAVAFPSGFGTTTDVRNTYAVGTIEVRDTSGATPFSLAAASTGTGGPPAFTVFGTSKRQVAMLQWNDVAANGNFIQRYFYGTTTTGGEADYTRATNARAISVWRGATVLDDRIAICGETFDQALPQSQDLAGWANSNAANSSGFIAVYDGTGRLRWTHHFFDPTSSGSPNDPGQASCAVTDLSIRVEMRDVQGTPTAVDVVTYCGISSLGSPAGGELSPLQPFTVIAGLNAGDATLPGGQWDGFVGRVEFVGTTSQRVFHSVVGGDGQDGLFGLAELDANRFVVVGSSDGDGFTAFPFDPLPSPTAAPHVVGTLARFDSTGLAVGGTGNLVHSGCIYLGGDNDQKNTMARDVWVGRDVYDDVPLDTVQHPSSITHKIYVVGSTDDPSFSWSTLSYSFAPLATQATLQGPTDGFLCVHADDSLMTGITYSYHGGTGDDGLVGVGSWNEFNEHVTVVGFTDANGGDIDVGTYFFNNSGDMSIPQPPPAPPKIINPLLRIRQRQIGGANLQRPAAMGSVNATTVGLAWDQHGLGQAAGGGVAVGEDGRSNVVGQTNGPGLTPVGGGRSYDALNDAIRIMADMVPQGVAGTGRTDGTGFQTGVSPTFPPAVSSGYTGGTTPFCSLAEYGNRIGDPAPNLERMFIDVEGSVTVGSTNVAILVSRPTPQPGSISTGVLQVSFPPSTPYAYITGCEIWLGSSAYSYGLYPVPGSQRAYRLAFAVPLAPGTGPISAQMVCLLASPVTGSASGCSSTWTASPAIWFGW